VPLRAVTSAPSSRVGSTPFAPPSLAPSSKGEDPDWYWAEPIGGGGGSPLRVDTGLASAWNARPPVVGGVEALGVMPLPTIVGEAPPSQPPPTQGLTSVPTVPPAWFPVPNMAPQPPTGIPTSNNMVRAEGGYVPPLSGGPVPAQATQQPQGGALNP